MFGSAPDGVMKTLKDQAVTFNMHKKCVTIEVRTHHSTKFVTMYVFAKSPFVFCFLNYSNSCIILIYIYLKYRLKISRALIG